MKENIWQIIANITSLIAIVICFVFIYLGKMDNDSWKFALMIIFSPQLMPAKINDWLKLIMTYLKKEN